ncbi:MAG TPA: hypothetical protein DD490_10470, partial [Acidobacteria bacterium]|nr:hypothetical protein [Acidobacteriota bacterium]
MPGSGTAASWQACGACAAAAPARSVPSTRRSRIIRGFIAPPCPDHGGTGGAFPAGPRGLDRTEAHPVHPLSHGQAALWFLTRRAPESAAYHLVAAARVRCPDGGTLDATALRRTFQQLAARHGELRATFEATPDGTPVKRLHARLDPEFLELDAADWSEEEIRARLAAQAGRPFDLERGPL